MAALITTAAISLYLSTPTTAALSLSLSTPITLHHRFFAPIQTPTSPSKQILFVYVHGLDSSSTTWSPFLECDAAADVGSAPLHRSYPSYCVDLRGHGMSDLGDPSKFTSESVADDVLNFISSVSGGGGGGGGALPTPSSPKSKTKVVLVGHSMGGRVAMLAAAKATKSDVAPKLTFEVSALVVEDMDIKVRPPPFNVTWGEGNFIRKFSTLEDCSKALSGAGYEESRILSWATDGRIRKVEGDGEGEGEAWWSDVNPQARQLSYDRILNSDCGEVAIEDLRDNDFAESTTFVIAGSGKGMQGTVCDKESLEKMRRRLRGCDAITIEGAGHSIHKTHKDEFGGILDGVCRGLL